MAEGILVKIENAAEVRSATDQTDSESNESQAETSKAENSSPFTYDVEKGVYYKGEGDEIFVCSPLKVIAITRDKNGQNFGRLVEWIDSDNQIHRWAIPMEMTAGDGLDLRKVLLGGGLPHISPKARRLIIDYVATTKTEARATCVDRTGWHDGCFVLPDCVIGNNGKTQVIFQTDAGEANHFRKAGTRHEWQQHVARYCVGNSRLLFAVSMAYAAPLLELISMDGGGFNFKGNSSEGKSTAAQVAASVCGGPEYVCSWRATSNGLEGIAAAHNDGLLVLDEMSQVAPKEAGEVAYMLANGQGKQRAGRSGSARAKRQWRTLLLSNGEISLEDHLLAAGQVVKAGQEVRLADIPMNTGVFGGFENLHGFKNGGELADHLKTTSSQYYGAPLRDYLNALSEKGLETIRATTKTIQKDFIDAHCPKDAQGQVRRVATRFAVVAAGGDFATSLGITGWPKNAAIDAAEKCFKAWLQNRGGHADMERVKALSQVVEFFQANGSSRFSNWFGGDQRTIIGRVGYRECTQGMTRYFVFTNLFRTEVCRGVDHKLAIEILESNGLLECDSGRNTYARKPPDEEKSVRFYCIKGEVINK